MFANTRVLRSCVNVMAPAGITFVYIYIVFGRFVWLLLPRTTLKGWFQLSSPPPRDPRREGRGRWAALEASVEMLLVQVIIYLIVHVYMQFW